jgi:predicted TIM-barrel fold metal-dependent hydrolase
MRDITDFHIHFAGEDAMYQKDKGSSASLDYSIDEIIEEMDYTQTRYAIISSLEPMLRYSWSDVNKDGGLPYGGNECVASAIVKSGGRLLGAFVPYPYRSARQIEKDIEHFVKDHDFRAIKVHPWLGSYPANAVELYPVFEVASEYRLPVLYHSGTIPFTTPAQMYDMAKRYPDVPVVMGHAGSTELWHDVIALAAEADNLFIETSGQSNRIFLEEFAARIGSDRILYGSDWLGQPGKMLFRKLEVEELELSEADKENIFRNNANRLLGLQLG